MKLFTIGDSVSQGFMSAAAARTDLTYSTLMARSMGLKLNEEYRYPNWEFDGLPLNLERTFRHLVGRYGSNIRGQEWLTVLQTLNNMLDEVEDHYERGLGAADKPYRDPALGGRGGGGNVEYFHNVAVQGFDVADSWLVTPEKCEEMIANEPGRGESFLLPNAAFYRTALKVLNPSLKSKYADHSQLKWLEQHAANPEEGVENLILWLGANNALGTVVGLKPKAGQLKPRMIDSSRLHVGGRDVTGNPKSPHLRKARAATLRAALPTEGEKPFTLISGPCLYGSPHTLVAGILVESHLLQGSIEVLD